METLTIDHIKMALAGRAAAFRSITDYQPAGGSGDKVSPPTYMGGKYATEKRYLDGNEVDCVLMDSVQSQANRMEEALRDEWESNSAPIPVVTVNFTGDMPKPFLVTSLDAPHRIVDALLRDSHLDGIRFRESDVGKKLDVMGVKNATPLFELCPTALLFGMWDSTGPRGGSGVKIQRAIVSEMVGFHATQGVKTSSRIDPAEIIVKAGPLYKTPDGHWTLDPDEAHKDSKGNPELYRSPRSDSAAKAGSPSNANHGNIPPDISDGGFTISKARQTTTISLPAIRRLRFPMDGPGSDAAVDNAAQTVLVALGLFAATLVREQGADLRSRCLLIPTAPVVWEMIDKPGEDPCQFDITSDQARRVYIQAVKEAKAVGLPWLDDDVDLEPSKELFALVRDSQIKAADIAPDAADTEE